MSGPLNGLEPLNAPDGHPYNPRRLPCTARPAWWDDEATPPQRRRARQACTGCPARGPCSARAADLGPLASGTWAGVRLADLTADLQPAAYDGILATDVAATNTVIPAPAPARG